MDSNLPPESEPAAPPPAPNAPPTIPPTHRPPPVITPGSPNRPPRRSGGWLIAVVLLVALLGVSLLFNLRGLVGGMANGRSLGDRSSGPRMDEVVLKDNDAANKIAVIDISGVISSQSLESGGLNMVTLVKEEFRRANNDRDVKAVLLKVDSPGGEVLAADDIAKVIGNFVEKSHKPVVVSMGSMAASGGYYVSAPCSWIVANELTITGSIGVIMHGYNYRGLLDKVGVRPEVYKSGKFKDMMSSTKSPEETSPEERQMVQSLIDETFDKFKTVVREGRRAAYRTNKEARREGRQLSPEWESYADGRILSGTEAYKLGFVDELGDFDKAVERAEELAHIRSKHANLISYQPVFDLANLFRLFGESNAKGVKIDLGIDMPKLQPGCMYFLAPTFFH